MYDFRKTGPNLRQKFLLHPWLASEERELEFLRKMAEMCLIYLLPPPYVAYASVRHLLREILACTGTLLSESYTSTSKGLLRNYY